MSAAEDQDLADLQFFEIPGMRQLTDQQNTGAACVWCADDLAPGAGVNLQAGTGWAPYSCPTATPQQTALLRARTAAHKSRPICVSCHAPLTQQDLAAGTFAPLVWMGNSSSHRGFIHTGACLWNGGTL
ncbi:hypothetical protein ACIQNU_27855 [Streptomyces sp. NPDC091292]|uniref:hypothetical protein n=1 Tax=Streptomyces sp. NPDC091292 TaxID=3365991 RepID=UPI003813618A